MLAHDGTAYRVHAALVDMTGAQKSISGSNNATLLRTVFRLLGDIACKQAQYTLPIYLTSNFRICREVYGLGVPSSLSKLPEYIPTKRGAVLVDGSRYAVQASHRGWR